MQLNLLVLRRGNPSFCLCKSNPRVTPPLPIEMVGTLSIPSPGLPAPSSPLNFLPSATADLSRQGPMRLPVSQPVLRISQEWEKFRYASYAPCWSGRKRQSGNEVGADSILRSNSSWVNLSFSSRAHSWQGWFGIAHFSFCIRTLRSGLW